MILVDISSHREVEFGDIVHTTGIAVAPCTLVHGRPPVNPGETGFVHVIFDGWSRGVDWPPSAVGLAWV